MVSVLCCHLLVEVLIFCASTVDCRTDGYETFRAAVLKDFFLSCHPEI